MAEAAGLDGEGARIFGGAIFGGPLSFAVVTGNSAIKQITGKDVGELALALIDSDTAESEILSAGLSPEPPRGNIDLNSLSAISPAAGPVAARFSNDPGPTGSKNEAALLSPETNTTALSERRTVVDYLDRMSDAHKALLLSSVGMAPDATKHSEPREVAHKIADIPAKVRAVIPLETPTPIPIVHTAPKPGKISVPRDITGWQNSATTPGVDLNSPESVANAMARALDKYDQTFDASHKRSGHVDSNI